MGGTPVWLSALTRCQDNRKVSSPPNIILIMADDISAKEFSCYGHPRYKTPHLDALARTGVRFRTCWATPISSPSRAEIMTGRYGFQTGWFHNQMKPPAEEPEGNLARSNEVFAGILNDAGYATAVCGKWQLRGSEKQHGFDENCIWVGMESGIPEGQTFDGPVETEGMTLPGRTARYWHPAIRQNGRLLPTAKDDYGPDIFVDFLLDFAKRKKGSPFLVYYPMCLPHKSWDFEAGRSGYLPVPEVDSQGKKTGRKVPGSKQSNVEYIDHLMGRIVKGLESLNLRENTVVLFTSDNGTSGYGKGSWIQERGQRVPMIVNCPGIVEPQGALDTLVDFSDVLPTLCDLAGVSIPDDYVIDGKSFADTLHGDNSDEREWIFSYYADRRMLRDKRWLKDGSDRFYDCNGHRDEEGYKDVTDSNDPEVVAAKERFRKILEKLPPPNAQQEEYRVTTGPAPAPEPKKPASKVSGKSSSS